MTVAPPTRAITAFDPDRFHDIIPERAIGPPPVLLCLAPNVAPIFAVQTTEV